VYCNDNYKNNYDSNCDWDCYHRRYPELKDIDPNDLDQRYKGSQLNGWDHYHHYGYGEGRICTCDDFVVGKNKKKIELGFFA